MIKDTTLERRLAGVQPKKETYFILSYSVLWAYKKALHGNAAGLVRGS